MKRIIMALAVTLLIAGMLLAACGPKPTPEPVEPTAKPAEPTPKPAEPTATPAVVTVTFLEHFSTEWGDEWWNEKVAEFEAQHPNIKIDRFAKPYGELWTSLTTWAQSDDLPDTTQLQTPWMAQLAEWNSLLDMQPIVEKYGDDEFIENTGPMGPYFFGNYKGTTYAIPWGMRVIGLFYNKEYFEENNLEVPGTWAELEELLRYLRDEKGTYGLSMVWDKTGGPQQWPMKHFAWRLRGAGGIMYDENNNPTFSSSAGKVAMEYWKRLYDEDLIAPNSEATTVQQSRGDFCSGKVPMAIEGPWIVGTCATLGGDFTVAMAPGLCGEETCGNNILVTLLGISASSENPEAVFEFIKYLTSDEFTIDFTKSWGMTFANPAYFELPEAKTDPVMSVAAELTEDPDNFPHNVPIPKGAEIDQRFLEIWQEVFLEGKPIDEALDEMEAVAIELTK